MSVHTPLLAPPRPPPWLTTPPAHPVCVQSDHPLFREINIAGTNIVPNVILPKPAISLNMAAPKPVAQPKINIPSHQVGTDGWLASGWFLAAMHSCTCLGCSLAAAGAAQ